MLFLLWEIWLKVDYKCDIEIIRNNLPLSYNSNIVQREAHGNLIMKNILQKNL